MTRSVWWMTALCMAAALSGHAERMMVKDSQVRLYQDRKVSGSITRGIVVETQPAESDRRYLMVTWNGEQHSAEAKSFIGKRALEDLLGDRVIDLTTELETVDRDLKHQYERLDGLYATIVHVQRDVALVYRTETREVVVLPGATTGTVQIRITTDPVISASKARRLERDLLKIVAETQAEITELWTKREAAVSSLRAARYQRDTWLARFDGDVGAASEWQTYVVTTETATLWEDRKVNITRPGGTQLSARPHPESTGWVQVSLDGKLYAVRDTQIRSLEDLQSSRLELLSKLETQEHALTQQIALLENQRRRRQDLGKDLNYASRLNERIVLVTDGVLTPGFGTVYVVDSPRHGSIVAIDRSEARDVLRDWEKEQKPLQAELDQATAALANVRKDLARVEHDLRDLGVQLPAVE